MIKFAMRQINAVTDDVYEVWAMRQACFLRVRATKAGWCPRWAGLAALTGPAFAQPSGEPVPWQLNMGHGVTTTSQNAYDAHILALWICVGIGVVVFGAMGYAIFKFRKSKGVTPAQFSHNTIAEIIWTVIPVLLLIAMALPASNKLIAMYDTRDAEMTIKVIGLQWMWEYEYLGENVRFTSRLDRDSDRLRQNRTTTRTQINAHPAYLLDVDNPLVLPINTKIRFVITADDVIHSWWVPALGWKQDAIPGIINEAWTEILEPGTYRGQCAELCGKDHGFMPVVVKALPRDEFDAWLAAQKTTTAPAATPAPAEDPRSPDAAASDATTAITPALVADQPLV